jgi:3alpha(or 20beta)-hydroxysteroid dehydrogenase
MSGEVGRVAGKVAIVTGGARGVGAETARLLVDHGARVIIADILEEQGRALVVELGADAVFCRADVGLLADWDRLIAAAHGFGPVSVLVNNAAILKMASLADTSAEMFEALFRVNQLGPLLGIKAVMGDMIAAGGGSIVNVGSVDGLTGQDLGLSAYGATKWALRGIAKMAAFELGRHGVRVNCVHPDGGNPQMSAEFLPVGMDPVEAMAGHVHQTLEPPRGQHRGNRMRDIANMILFLASDESAGCTAGDYPVDGGYSAGRRFIP